MCVCFIFALEIKMENLINRESLIFITHLKGLKINDSRGQSSWDLYGNASLSAICGIWSNWEKTISVICSFAESVV